MAEVITNVLSASDGTITTLAASIASTGATTITTAAAAPAALQAGEFRIRIDSELLLVTGGQSGTTWTVTRGVEGSAAATHASGGKVRHVLTAGAIDSLVSAQSGSGTPNTFTAVPASGAAQTLIATGAPTDIVYVTVTDDLSVTLEDAGNDVVSVILAKYKQGGSGDYTLTHADAIEWPNQAPPILDPGVGKSLWVNYVNPGDGSGWVGLPAAHEVQAASAPAAPTGLAGVVTDDVVNLGWNAPSNTGGAPLTGFAILKGATSGTETLYDTIGNVTSYADTDGDSGVEAFYKVAAINSIGTGAASNEVSVGGGLTPFFQMTSPAAGDLTSATPEIGAAFTLHPSKSGASPVVTAAHRIRSNDAADTIWISSTTPPSADYTFSAIVESIVSAWGTVALLLRLDPTAETYYAFRFSGVTPHYECYKYVAGSYTELATSVLVGGDVDTPHEMTAVITGDNFSCFADGVQIFNVTDATITAAGKIGLYFYENPGSDSSGNQLSNLLAAA